MEGIGTDWPNILCWMLKFSEAEKNKFLLYFVLFMKSQLHLDRSSIN